MIVPGELWFYPSNFKEMNFGHLGFSFQDCDLNNPKKKIYGFSSQEKLDLSFSSINKEYKSIIENHVEQFRINQSNFIKVKFYLTKQSFELIPNLYQLIDSKLEMAEVIPIIKYAFPWSDKFKRTYLDKNRLGFNCITFIVFNLKPRLYNGKLVSAGQLYPKYSVGSITEFSQNYGYF